MRDLRSRQKSPHICHNIFIKSHMPVIFIFSIWWGMTSFVSPASTGHEEVLTLLLNDIPTLHYWLVARSHFHFIHMYFSFYHLFLKSLFVIFSGTNDQKGKIMGIFRSLGALARGIGPFVYCSGNAINSSAISVLVQNYVGDNWMGWDTCGKSSFWCCVISCVFLLQNFSYNRL